VIATPDKFHAGAIIAAAEAGKGILYEKPLAITLADAHAALQAVAKSGVRLQIGFMRGYDPAYVAALKRVEAHEIGEPVLFKSVGRDKEAPPIAAYQSNVNGMILYNNTIHDFDLARWLMRDEITEVHTYGTVAIWPEVARYGDVVASLVNLSYSRASDWQYRILCAGGVCIRRAYGDRGVQGICFCWQSLPDAGDFSLYVR
jgi:scyllo-inositol 2-dehydrogenase (NAD+)